jgi:small subunit ribosomal protein S21
MARVQARPDESAESLLRRFRKMVSESGVLKDVRRKRWYMSPSEVRRLEKKKAIRRARRRQRQEQSRRRF